MYSPGLELRAQSAEEQARLKNEGVDLLPFTQRIEIYESIFENTISASLVLLEDVGLVEYVPIVGAEVVSIAFKVEDETGEDREYKQVFRVIKVHDMTYPKQGFRLYTIELATPEFVQSVSTRISRMFNNTTPALAVKTILKDYMGAEFVANGLEPTSGTYTVTIPNYTPLQAINYFTMLAQTWKSPRESNFLFFQTLNGFYFKSIYQLILEGKALKAGQLYTPDGKRKLELKTFNVDPGAVTDKKVEDEVVRNTMMRIHQDQSFDVMLDIAGGMLRSRMTHFDFLARRVAGDPVYKTDVDSEYTKSFGQTTHLADHPVYPRNFEQSVSKNTRIFTFPSNAWSSKSAYIKSIEPQQEQTLYQSIVLRNRQLREIQHLQTLIDTPGHPDIQAGTVIDVQYPSSPGLQQSNAPQTAPVHQEPTPYYSGLHLVGGIRHILSIRSSGAYEYRMHMRVIRDSLNAPLVGFKS